MMQLKHEWSPGRSTKRAGAGFTLAEVVICVAIIATVFGSILLAYNQATWRAEWSGYSLAAQSLATQQLEQARAAIWDPSLMDTNSVGRNEITNIPLSGRSVSGGVVQGYSAAILDLPISTNGGPVWATNYVTIQTVYPNFGGSVLSNVPLQMVLVNTVWQFRTGRINKFYTNSLSTYFAPDNRDASTL